MSTEAASYCTGCGRPGAECPGGCRRPLDPPRFCPDCGNKLFAQVTPQGYLARCKKHGEFDLSTLEGHSTQRPSR